MKTERMFYPQRLSMLGVLWKPVLVSAVLFFGPQVSRGSTIVVDPAGGCPAIQNAINSTPMDGGEIVIQRGHYTCHEPIVIDRNNLVLRGNGTATILRLANSANAPVIVIGQTVTPPLDARYNIRVADLLIDGNKDNQTFECYGGDCGASPLRNNGITIRYASDVLIERVTVLNARSGGLVTELGCVRITVREFRAANNYFDGLAGYRTEDSTFTGLRLIDNGAAGLSFDLGFNNNLITETVIAGSKKVGIFMRDSVNNLFDGLQVRNSGEHGIFLAQPDQDATRPAARNTFSAFVISGSQQAGIRVNDASCVDNLFVGGQLISNVGGCISEDISGLAQTAGVICR